MCNFCILCASAQRRDSKEDERVRGRRREGRETAKGAEFGEGA